jgi:DNA-binding transcriptional LysR family regulator
MHPNLLLQLQMFVTAAELGSFSATAKQLGRAQNVVSYSISILEDSLGVQLFDRGGHKVVLTDAGEALKRQAVSIVNASTDLARRAGELSLGLEPFLSIAVDEMVPFELIQLSLDVLSDRFPGLEIRINRTAGQEAIGKVDDGSAQFGVVAGVPNLFERFSFSIVSHVDIVPVINPDFHQAASDDGFDQPTLRQIVLSSSDAPEASPDMGVFSANIWRVHDLRSKLELIRHGLGWGAMPRQMVKDDLARRDLVGLRIQQFAEVPRMPVIQFHLAQTALGPAALLFRATLLGSASAALAE